MAKRLPPYINDLNLALEEFGWTRTSPTTWRHPVEGEIELSLQVRAVFDAVYDKGKKDGVRKQ